MPAMDITFHAIRCLFFADDACRLSLALLLIIFYAIIDYAFQLSFLRHVDDADIDMPPLPPC